MRLFSVVAGVALAAIAFAQDQSIAFTSVPASVVVGHQYNLTWGGGDGTSAVTIALRKGPVDSISTVQILTTSATNSSYIWTPSSSLINGDDYTLQITQGLNDINFSGDFTVSGGVDPFSASISSILASASSALASANSTITALASATSSLAAASSSGTGTALPRNTTFSSATLGASGTGSSATSTGAGSGAASSTSSGTGTSSSSTAGAVVLTAPWTNPIAFFVAILAAIVYAT